MDGRNYVRYLRADFERQREEAWRELHRRPDAEPLPDEPDRPWTERILGVRWLIAGATRIRTLRPTRVPPAQGQVAAVHGPPRPRTSVRHP